jgi:hypothetical protein
MRSHSLRDTGPAMSEESATPDLVELTRRSFEAGNRRDLDAAMSFYEARAAAERLAEERG